MTYHIHDNTSTTKTGVAIGFDAYTAAKSGLSEDYRTSSSGCYTKQWYSATKTVKTYHPATSATTHTTYACSCSGFVSTGRYAYGHDGYAPDEICGRCDHTRASHVSAGKCVPQTTTIPGTAAYWSTDSTTNVTGWGACPSNSNNGSTEITYSNVSYRYYPNCGHTNGQISKIELDLD